MKIVFFLLCWPLSVLAYPFFETHGEGWFWYQSPDEEKKAFSSLLSFKSPSPTETLMTFRKNVEDSLNLAILSPTEENLKRYAEYYFETIRRGQQFTDAYKVMLLNHPQYDYSLKFPTNHLVQPLYEQRQKKITELKIQQFSKQHGFFFFLAGRCQYCHAFAPIVKQFVEKYGVSMVPISLDGAVLPEFPKVIADNGTAKALNVYSLPALFAVNPKNQEVIAIANGMMSLAELEENILRIMEMGYE